jgi:hypothetical protein
MAPDVKPVLVKRREALERLEGSRFGTYLNDLPTFVSARCTTVNLSNRRLPGTL